VIAHRVVQRALPVQSVVLVLRQVEDPVPGVPAVTGLQVLQLAHRDRGGLQLEARQVVALRVVSVLYPDPDRLRRVPRFVVRRVRDRIGRVAALGLGLRLVVVDVEVLGVLVPQHVGVVDRQVVGEALPASVVAGRQVLCLVRDARRDRDQIEAPGGVAVAVVVFFYAHVDRLRVFRVFKGPGIGDLGALIPGGGRIGIGVVGDRIFVGGQSVQGVLVVLGQIENGTAVGIVIAFFQVFHLTDLQASVADLETAGLVTARGFAVNHSFHAHPYRDAIGIGIRIGIVLRVGNGVFGVLGIGLALVVFDREIIGILVAQDVGVVGCQIELRHIVAATDKNVGWGKFFGNGCRQKLYFNCIRTVTV